MSRRVKLSLIGARWRHSHYGNFEIVSPTDQRYVNMISFFVRHFMTGVPRMTMLLGIRTCKIYKFMNACSTARNIKFLVLDFRRLNRQWRRFLGAQLGCERMGKLQFMPAWVKLWRLGLSVTGELNDWTQVWAILEFQRKLSNLAGCSRPVRWWQTSDPQELKLQSVTLAWPL